MKKEYTKEQLAKYIAVSTTGLLQMLSGFITSRKLLRDIYENVLKDLDTGSMEKSIKQYNDAIQEAENNKFPGFIHFC